MLSPGRACGERACERVPWRVVVTDGEGLRCGTSCGGGGTCGRYEGEFRDDKKHGQGTNTWADGNR